MKRFLQTELLPLLLYPLDIVSALFFSAPGLVPARIREPEAMVWTLNVPKKVMCRGLGPKPIASLEVIEYLEGGAYRKEVRSLGASSQEH
jgi:hypothetical protein